MGTSQSAGITARPRGWRPRLSNAACCHTQGREDKGRAAARAMKKNDRITAYMETLGADPRSALDPHYQGFFTCFNRGEYYQAHEVLEHLWLQTPGADHAFFKGLIQIAGAFVHLQKQFLAPDHPKDGLRLRPAARLLARGLRYIDPYGPVHLRLDIAALHLLCARHAAMIDAGHFTRNPWHPEALPQLTLLPAAG